MDSPVLVKEEVPPPFSPSEPPTPIVVDVKTDEEDVKPSLASLPTSGSASPSSHSPPPDTTEESSASTPTASSSSRSPPPSSTPKPKKPKAPRKPKVTVEDVPKDMSHLPLADEEASKTYTKMTTNHHQFNTLGRSHQDEDAMVCDCSFRPDRDEPHQACGEGSGCINRLTQVECLENECRSREHCQNQRFNRKEYANIEVVKTERKGYGLRAAEDIDSDAFIYEYIGEVVQQSTFMKRMREYAESGIRHFYFMMLQKEEYLDATKKGGIGRFANHSCNPNCYVAKWVVGKRMRMGIFAKRDIIKGEELTFNYNVDRYGHDAQPCYCDEPNCVGSIGGKTQTDVGGMDDLYLDALGIADEVEQYGLKGNRKKKGRKLGEDFMPDLKPVQEHEVPKLIAAVRQSTSNRPMLTKLLSRVKMTNDEAVQRQVMRMHGFNLMGNVLRDFGDDKDVVKLVIETMSAWPMQGRNKIIDSKIEESIKSTVEKEENAEAREAADQLLESWSKLPTNYRIAKRPVRIPDAGDDKENGSESPAPSSNTSLPTPTPTHEKINPFTPLPNPPSSSSTTPVVDNYFASLVPTAPRPLIPRSMESPRTPGPSDPSSSSASTSSSSNPTHLSTPAASDLQKYLATLKFNRDTKEKERVAAEAAAAALAASKPAPDPSKKRKKSSLGGSSSRSANASSSSVASGSGKEGGLVGLESQKEKRLTKMVGEVVVKSMSKYKEQIGESERFKKYAKECTNLIVRKEKQSTSYMSTPSLPPPLNEEKQAKMKKFTKDFVHRLLKKSSSSSHSHRSSTNGANGSSSSSHHHRALNGTNGVGEEAGSSSTTPATTTAATTPNDYDPEDGDGDAPMDLDEVDEVGGEYGLEEGEGGGDASPSLELNEEEEEDEDEGGARGPKEARLTDLDSAAVMVVGKEEVMVDGSRYTSITSV